MSSVLILAPVIAGAWPVYASLLTGVATSMGYSLLKGFELASTNECCEEKINEEAVEEAVCESTHKVAATMKDGDSLSFKNENHIVTFVKDPRGMCKCLIKAAPGKNISKAKLKAEAQKIINKVTQTYVYNKLKDELKNKGYNIITDDVSGKEKIKITVRKWK